MGYTKPTIKGFIAMEYEYARLPAYCMPGISTYINNKDKKRTSYMSTIFLNYNMKASIATHTCGHKDFNKYSVFGTNVFRRRKYNKKIEVVYSSQNLMVG